MVNQVFRPGKATGRVVGHNTYNDNYNSFAAGRSRQARPNHGSAADAPYVTYIAYHVPRGMGTYRKDERAQRRRGAEAQRTIIAGPLRLCPSIVFRRCGALAAGYGNMPR